MSISCKQIILPYDSVNIIFGYLSQLLDAKWTLVFDNQGRIRLRVNRYFSQMPNLHVCISCKFYFATYFDSGYTILRIQNNFIQDQDVFIEVRALKQYREIQLSGDMQAASLIGFEYYGICYSYTNPLTNLAEHIYIDMRYNSSNQTTEFVCGSLFKPLQCQQQTTYHIIDYDVTDGVTSVLVQSWVLDWAGEHELVAAQALLELNEEEEEEEEEENMDEIDYTAFLPLQMYM